MSEIDLLENFNEQRGGNPNEAVLHSYLNLIENFDAESVLQPSLNLIENFKEQKGGTKDELVEEEELYYKETLNYIENIKGEDYKNYIREFENYFKEQSNKNKYIYETKNNSLVKKNIKSNKINFKIELPEYKNVSYILKQINDELDDTKYEFNKLKKLILHKPSMNNNKFKEIQTKFIQLVHLQQVFSTYHYKINNKDVINNRLNYLFEERNIKKKRLDEINSKIKEINNSTKNYSEIKKLCTEYLQIDNIKEIDKTISELVSIPSLDYVVVNLPKIINSSSPKAIENKPVDEPVSKPKLKIKKKLKIKQPKPEEEPTVSDIKTTVIDEKGKKRRQIKGKKVIEGNCMFPFKEKDKYIKEDDGCLKSKDGDWCATDVDKNDYSYDKIGFCKK